MIDPSQPVNSFGQPPINPNLGPNQVAPIPVPGSKSDLPSLEEIAAQIQAANAPPSAADSNPTPAPPAADPAPAPVASPPPPESLSDRVNQPPTPDVSLNLKLARLLAAKEIIGETQVDSVAASLNPADLQSLMPAATAPASRLAATLPISLLQPDGQEVHASLKTADVFAFLTGKTDTLTAELK